MDNRPIGVFDSGLGGLTVWRELRRALTNESLIYFGDGKNCPYGPRPYQEVVGYVDQAVRFLLDKDIKLLVVACNAATTAAIDYLRDTYSIPFVGMEPAVKPAALASKSGVIGILATEATLRGGLYRNTASKYEDRVKIITAVGEGFVELVESDAEDTPEARNVVKSVMREMLEAGADQIVLGCTHYPFLSQAINDVIAETVPNGSVELVDPAPAVERRVRYLLQEQDIAASEDNKPFYEFYTAADSDYLDKVIAKSEAILRQTNVR